MQASILTLLLPTPLGFSAVRGLGLQEGQHLAGELCAVICLMLYCHSRLVLGTDTCLLTAQAHRNFC